MKMDCREWDTSPRRLHYINIENVPVERDQLVKHSTCNGDYTCFCHIECNCFLSQWCINSVYRLMSFGSVDVSSQPLSLTIVFFFN